MCIINLYYVNSNLMPIFTNYNNQHHYIDMYKVKQGAEIPE